MQASANTKKNSGLAKEVANLRVVLWPIYQLPAGPMHEAYPKTMLHLLLLSEEQIDSMAAFYGQSVKNEWTAQYPGSMNWDADFLADPALTERERKCIKTRKFAKFIGLRGCETPVEETAKQLRLGEARLKREIEQLQENERALDKGPRRWYGV